MDTGAAQVCLCMCMGENVCVRDEGQGRWYTSMKPLSPSSMAHAWWRGAEAEALRRSVTRITLWLCTVLLV